MTVYYPYDATYERADSTIIKSGGWSPPPNGYNFDGVNDGLKLGSTHNVGINGCIRFMASIDNTGDLSIIGATPLASGTQMTLRYTTTTGALAFRPDPDIAKDVIWTISGLNDGIIRYYVIVKEDTTVRLYIDNILQSVTSNNLLANESIYFNSYAYRPVALNYYLQSKLIFWDALNFIPSSELLVKLYNNGRPWESRLGSEYFTEGAGVVYDGDYAVTDTSLTVVDATLTFNNDAISDGTTSYDDCLAITCNTQDDFHYFYGSDVLSVGKKYRITITYYIPSTNNNCDHISILIGGASRAIVVNPAATIQGTWQTYTSQFFGENMGNKKLYIMMDDGGEDQFQDITGTDVVYIKDVKIEALGETFSIRPESVGIYSAYDTSENGNFATVTGATPINKNEHQRAYKDAITGDTMLTNVIQGGYYSDYFVFTNTTANDVTINVGTTAGGNDIISGALIAGSTTELINAGLYTESTGTYYISSADWNSSSLNMKLMSKKL